MLWISLAGLAATACAQAIVVVLSGSVALLGDALHNSADALTAVPLGIAFLVGRRRPTRRYTYGYGRAEDLAGIVIVAVIVLSSAAAAYAASAAAAPASGHPPGRGGGRGRGRLRGQRNRRPVPDQDRAADIAVLVADGLHARADGFTSLAVLAGAGGPAIGWRWADPVAGLLITAAILTVGWQAAREVGGRLMDSVDPALTETAEATLRATPGVLDTGPVRLRWVGQTPCGPSATSWSTRAARSSRRTTSRSPRSTRSSTLSPGWPPSACTPTRWTTPITTPRSPITCLCSRPPRPEDTEIQAVPRHAAPRRVPVSPGLPGGPGLRPSAGVSPLPRPRATMSGRVEVPVMRHPARPQVHSRTLSGLGPSFTPHAEHTWEVGSNRWILGNMRPYRAALYPASR